MNPLTITPKTTIIVLLVVVLLSVWAGVSLTPKQITETAVLNETYSGRIVGNGYFSIDKKPADKGAYSGNLQGNFNGTLFRLGVPVTALAYVSGSFNGYVSGSCKNDACTEIDGEISGDCSSCQFLGKIQITKQSGFVIPFEWQIVIVVFLFLLFLHFTGNLQKIFGLFGGGKSVYIRLKYNIFIERLRVFLDEEADIQNYRRILDVLEDEETTYALVELSANSEKICVRYRENIFWVMQRDVHFEDWSALKENTHKKALNRELSKGMRQQLTPEELKRIEDFNKLNKAV